MAFKLNREKYSQTKTLFLFKKIKQKQIFFIKYSFLKIFFKVKKNIPEKCKCPFK